ncbi:MAG: hypothetical protein N2644_07715 [Candidatus Sumerlaea chitinivorans]|nr:hypothetical protein [Candidatus Sumerlaea chitinivorans]
MNTTQRPQPSAQVLIAQDDEHELPIGTLLPRRLHLRGIFARDFVRVILCSFLAGVFCLQTGPAQAKANKQRVLAPTKQGETTTTQLMQKNLAPTQKPANQTPATEETRSPDPETTGAFLPNQWKLAPVGSHLPLGDLPVSLAKSPDGRYAAILHCGYGEHEVRIFDLEKRKQTARAEVDNAWLGLAFAPDGSHLYLSGGTDDRLLAYRFDRGKLASPMALTLRLDRATTQAKENPWYPSGIALTQNGKVGYVACQQRGALYAFTPLGTDEKVADDAATASATSKRNRRRGDRAALAPAAERNARLIVRFREPHPAPYKVLLHPKRPVAYVSLWGARAVAEVNLRSRSYRLIPTDSHPNDMVMTRDGRRLFVACANTNYTDVIDLEQRRVIERLDCALYPGMPPGATPNGLALSDDEKTLLVANADTNHVAVFDVSKMGKTRPRGFIPTAWYPTAVAFGPKNEILIVSAKGLGSKPNPKGPNPYHKNAETTHPQYIAKLFRGTLTFVEWPTEDQLRRYSQQALATSPLRPDLQPRAIEPNNPIPTRVGDPSPIRYVVYIIKENRTYDQVLGDMPEGNGDPSLCLFPEKVSPNHHALAREFVLFDNFYVESEVSADGHEWTTGAYATDYVEKTWPASYGNHGKIGYPAEGHSALGRPDKGHIWNQAKAAGVSYYSFGEWIVDGGPKCDGKAKDPDLRGHYDPCFAGYNLHVSDVDHRAKRFIEKLAEFERTNSMPQLILLRLPNDHTAGTRVGMLTPRAYVAQNDLALGMIIEALSRSRFWKEMAIFVVEDDAQNGPDHVDAHRTVALIASPYAKRGYHCRNMYSTASMLRTMELILGLQPMSQFDAAARPLYECFTATPDYSPYVCKPATYPLDEKNGPKAPMSKESALLNLEREDSNPDVWFNEIIWKSVHGPDSVMPAPLRAAFVWPTSEEREDED